MPTVKNVGEPCAEEPHARFDVAAGGNQASRLRRAAQAPPADPTIALPGPADRGRRRDDCIPRGRRVNDSNSHCSRDGGRRYPRMARFDSQVPVMSLFRRSRVSVIPATN